MKPYCFAKAGIFRFALPRPQVVIRTNQGGNERWSEEKC